MSGGKNKNYFSKESEGMDESESSSAFEQKFEARLQFASQDESVSDCRKGKDRADMNGYTPTAHENVHASGKKMRHEQDLKHHK